MIHTLVATCFGLEEMSKYIFKNVLLLRKGLDTVESLSVEVKGSKVENFTVLVTLSSTLLSTFLPLYILTNLNDSLVY